MTIGTRRQFVLLGGLLAVAVAIAVLRSPGADGDAGRAAGAATRSPASRADGVADLHLESLNRPATDRPRTRRNVFRFESRPSTASAPRALPTAEPVDSGPVGPVMPPPLPPIPLRYIGYVDQQGDVPRVAVLSDGRGNVFNGKEGDIIEGRYRVLRIGTDSADLIYVDGRGRQTIRLSGQ